MVTLGFTFGYSDVAVNGTPFPNGQVSTYLYVQTAGDIVYQGGDGKAQFLQGAGVGYHPVSTNLVLSSGTVNGTSRTTTASGIVWCAGGKY